MNYERVFEGHDIRYLLTQPDIVEALKIEDIPDFNDMEMFWDGVQECYDYGYTDLHYFVKTLKNIAKTHNLVYPNKSRVLRIPI